MEWKKVIKELSDIELQALSYALFVAEDGMHDDQVPEDAQEVIYALRPLVEGEEVDRGLEG